MAINSLDGYYQYVKTPPLDNAKLSGDLPHVENAHPANESASVKSAEHPKSEAVEKTQLEAAVKKMNESLLPQMASVKFLVHQESSKMVVTMVDTSDGKVLRKIPSMEVMSLSQGLQSGGDLKGLGVKSSA